MLHELRGRRTKTRFPVSINPLTEITIFGGSVDRENSDTSASESQRGRRVICRKDRSWRVSVKGRAEGEKEMWRARTGTSCPSRKTRRVSSATETRSVYSERSIDRSIPLSISRRGPIHQFFHGGTRRRETANDSEDRSPNREGLTI